MKENLDEPTGKHFNQSGHEVSHAQFEIIETLSNDPDDPASGIHRNKREKYWIILMRTLKPHGINLLFAQ